MKFIISMFVLLSTTAIHHAAEVRLLDLEPTDAQQIIEQQDQTLKYAPKIESNVPAVRYLGNEPHNVEEDIYLANQYHGQDGLGGYLYGYSVPDIAKTEKKKAGGDLRGAYNYIAGNGQEIKVEYWDDGTGFHQVDNVPKILPKQIDDTPEVQAAKEEHARLWQEQAERNSRPIASPYNSEGQYASGPLSAQGQLQRQQQFGQQVQFRGQPQGQYQGQPQGQFSQQQSARQQPQYQGQYSQLQGQYSQPQGQYSQPQGQYSQVQGQQPQLAQNQPKPVQYQPKPVQPQQKPGQQQPQVGQHQTQPGQPQPQTVQYQPHTGQNQPQSGQIQPQPGQLQPQPGQYKQSGQNQPQQPQIATQYQAKPVLTQTQDQNDIYSGQYSENRNKFAQAGGVQPLQGQKSQQGLYKQQGQYQTGQNDGQYQEGQDEGQYREGQDEGQYQEGQDEGVTGPPKGFFYSFDYPVGIIVSKDGSPVKDIYAENKAQFESQVAKGGGQGGSYLVQ